MRKHFPCKYKCVISVLSLLFFTPQLHLAAIPVSNAVPVQSSLFWNERSDHDALIEQIIASMSDEEIVSQLLLVGWETAEASVELRRWVQERGIGGIKIFGWNGKNVETLSQSISILQKDSLEQRNSIPLFTATDQEGGWVRHIKDTTSITPGNLAIGASRLPYDSYRSSYYIGHELREIGINLNFAPTVDVYTSPDAHVIGPRSFSSDPQLVATMAVAYYRGMQDNRVISVAKHFPGHGSANTDSHGTLPRIPDSFQTIWNRDLLPYRILVKEGIAAVLTAHLSYPNITNDNTPASFSPFFTRKVLRDILNFDGLLITDDLYMQGALLLAEEHNWSFARLCLEAVRVGNDMIMLSRTPKLNGSIWQTLISAYKNDPVLKERIGTSVKRILKTKLEYLKGKNRVHLFPDTKKKKTNSALQEHKEQFLFEHAARSVTVIRGGDKLPLLPVAGSRILLAGNDPVFHRTGAQRYGNVGHYWFSSSSFYKTNKKDLQEFPRIAANYDYVIFCLSDPNSSNILNSAFNINTQIIVFSILTPVYLQQHPWVDTAIAVYGWGRESFEAGFAVLQGDYRAEGQLPLEMLQ